MNSIQPKESRQRPCAELTEEFVSVFNDLMQVISANLELAKARQHDQASMLAALDRALEAAMAGGKLSQQLLDTARAGGKTDGAALAFPHDGAAAGESGLRDTNLRGDFGGIP